MGIKACKECKAEISTDANPCPKCGKKSPHGMSVIMMVGAGMLGLCVFSGVIGAIAKPHEGAERTTAAAAAAPRPAAVDVEALDLWNAYKANEVSADAMYKGRSLRVSGTVDSITKDFLDNVVVSLKAPNEFMSTMATMNETQTAAAGMLSKGQRVRVVCLGGGAVATIPTLKDCILD